mgnify:CR=1 FL=1
MPDDKSVRFEALRSELLEAGVAPRHVRRIVDELDDHVDDLCAEAIADGMNSIDAMAFAMQRIGDQQLIGLR